MDQLAMDEQLLSACRDGDLNKVKLLLSQGSINLNRLDSNNSTPFYVACDEGHVEIVKLLLNDERVDINQANEDEATPFYIACENGHTEIVKLLLNERVNSIEINKLGGNNNQTPFLAACQWGKIDVVKLLLNDPRVDINQANNSSATPFFGCL